MQIPFEEMPNLPLRNFPLLCLPELSRIKPFPNISKIQSILNCRCAYMLKIFISNLFRKFFEVKRFPTFLSNTIAYKSPKVDCVRTICWWWGPLWPWPESGYILVQVKTPWIWKGTRILDFFSLNHVPNSNFNLLSTYRILEGYKSKTLTQNSRQRNGRLLFQKLTGISAMGRNTAGTCRGDNWSLIDFLSRPIKSSVNWWGPSVNLRKRTTRSSLPELFLWATQTLSEISGNCSTVKKKGAINFISSQIVG